MFIIWCLLQNYTNKNSPKKKKQKLNSKLKNIKAQKNKVISKKTALSILSNAAKQQLEKHKKAKKKSLTSNIKNVKAIVTQPEVTSEVVVVPEVVETEILNNAEKGSKETPTQKDLINAPKGPPYKKRKVVSHNIKDMFEKAKQKSGKS